MLDTNHGPPVVRPFDVRNPLVHSRKITSFDHAEFACFRIDRDQKTACAPVAAVDGQGEKRPAVRRPFEASEIVLRQDFPLPSGIQGADADDGASTSPGPSSMGNIGKSAAGGGGSRRMAASPERGERLR